MCPACGYLRAGIATDARCPECGADGLDGCLVIMGTRRTAHSTALGALIIAVGATLAVLMHLSAHRAGPASVAALALLLVADGTLVAALLGKLPGLVPARGRTIVWTVHPGGIEIREGNSRKAIRRAEISRVDCADSMVGPVSQLSIVRSRWSAGGILGTTPVLYLHGELQARRQKWRDIRRVLELDRELERGR